MYHPIEITSYFTNFYGQKTVQLHQFLFAKQLQRNRGIELIFYAHRRGRHGPKAAGWKRQSRWS